MSAIENHTLVNRTALATAIALALPASVYGAAAARVDFAIGTVSAVDADGNTRKLRKGSSINNGDLVQTKRGRAQLRFSDGAFVSLQPNTDFRLDEYRFEEQEDGGGKGFFSLLKGGFRTITGLIGKTNKASYQVTTPVATIGIRGTAYSATFNSPLLVFTTLGTTVVANEFGSCVATGGTGCKVDDANSKPQPTSGGGGPAPEPVLCPDLDPYCITLFPQPGTDPDYTVSEDDTKLSFNDGRDRLLTSYSQGSDLVDAKFSAGSGLADGEFYAAAISFGGDSGAVRGTLASHDSAVGDLGNGSLGSSSVEGGTAGGVIGWGRWFNGTSTVDNFITESDASSYPSLTFNPNNGLHYVIGIPTTDMPVTGTATYAVVGATQPTIDSGAFTPGTLDKVFTQLVADFASAQVDIDIKLTIAGETYITDVDGISIDGFSFGFVGCNITTASGSSCFSGFCPTTITGFFAGGGAGFAGFAYDIFRPGDGRVINGAVALQATGAGGGGP